MAGGLGLCFVCCMSDVIRRLGCEGGLGLIGFVFPGGGGVVFVRNSFWHQRLC